MMPRLAAAGCLLGLAGVVAMSAERRSVRLLPPEPRGPGRVEGMTAALAPIGPLGVFAVNDENPFVPWQLRRPPAAAPAPADVGEVTSADAGPRPPAPPALPSGRRLLVDQPRCVGLVRHAPTGAEAVIVRGAGGEVALRPGEALDGWRLLALTPGAARFRSPHGGEVDIAVHAWRTGAGADGE